MENIFQEGEGDGREAGDGPGNADGRGEQWIDMTLSLMGYSDEEIEATDGRMLIYRTLRPIDNAIAKSFKNHQTIPDGDRWRLQMAILNSEYCSSLPLYGPYKTTRDLDGEGKYDGRLSKEQRWLVTDTAFSCLTPGVFLSLKSNGVKRYKDEQDQKLIADGHEPPEPSDDQGCSGSVKDQAFNYAYLPPTDRQLRFLKRLGIESIPRSKPEASTMIDGAIGHIDNFLSEAFDFWGTPSLREITNLVRMSFFRDPEWNNYLRSYKDVDVDYLREVVEGMVGNDFVWLVDTDAAADVGFDLDFDYVEAFAAQFDANNMRRDSLFLINAIAHLYRLKDKARLRMASNSYLNKSFDGEGKEVLFRDNKVNGRLYSLLTNPAYHKHCPPPIL